MLNQNIISCSIKSPQKIILKFVFFFLTFFSLSGYSNVLDSSTKFRVSEVVTNVYVDSSLADANTLYKAIASTSEIFHLFSHGRPGELFIEGKWKDKRALANWIKEKYITSNFKYLNIYGCNFAQGEKGLKAVCFLEKELGVAIAASTNITGKDGDWNLEVGKSNKTISTPAYLYNLQCTGPSGDCDNDGVPDAVDDDDDNDGILDSLEDNIVNNFANLLSVNNGVVNPNNALVDTPSTFASFNGFQDFVIGLENTAPANSIITVRVSKVGSPFARYNVYPTDAAGNNIGSGIGLLTSSNSPENQNISFNVATQYIRFFHTVGAVEGRVYTVNQQTGDVDVDNDGFNNSVDLDSDNDNCNDVVESGGADINNDGILDGTGIDITNGRVLGSTGGYNGTTGNETVATQLVISLLPSNQTVPDGYPTVFSVRANATSTEVYTGTAPNTAPNYGSSFAFNTSAGINYQWYLGDPTAGGTPLNNGGVYSGVDTPNLNISNTTGLDGNQYCVLLTHNDNECISEVRCASITLSPDLCDAANSNIPDTDNDTITDACDLDDDNDGIFDVNENVQGLFNGNGAQPQGANVTHNYELISGSNVVPFQAVASGGMVLEGPNIPFGGVGMDPEQRPAFPGQRITVNFSEDVHNLTLQFTRVVSQVQTTYPEFEIGNFIITYDNGDQVLNAVPMIISTPSESINSPGSMTTGINASGTHYIKASVRNLVSSSRITFENPNSIIAVSYEHLTNNPVPSGAVNLSYGFEPRARINIDTDNDGMPDSRDTDSDNDGCPDAIEAAENVVASQLLPNLAIDIANEGGIDSDGVPNLVNTGGAADINGNQAQNNTTQVVRATQVEITTPLADQTHPPGVAATFNVVARGDETTTYNGVAPMTTPNYSSPGNADAGLNYQWYLGDPNMGGTALANTGVYMGVTNPTLEIDDVTGLHGNQYCVLITHDDNDCIAEVSCAILSVIDPCDPIASGNLDTDGDGVSDICDLDNDNDGILDAAEGTLNNFGASQDRVIGAVSNPGNVLGNSPDLFSVYGGGSLSGITWTSMDTSLQAGNTLRLLVSSTGGTQSIEIAQANDINTTIFASVVFIPVSSTTPVEIEYSLNFNAPFIYIRGRNFRIHRLSESNILADIDSDSIPNYLDSDSDNDGCSDAIEGTENITANQLLPNGAIDIINQGGVDTDGVPNALSPGGQGQGSHTIAYSTATQIQITTIPLDQSVAAGGSATFDVVARGDQTITYAGTTPDYTNPGNADSGINYQWYIGNPDTGGTLLTNAGVYSGVDTPSLMISDVTGLNNKEYCVLVTHDDNECIREVNCATLTTTGPNIALLKTGVFVDGNGDGCASVGETIDYTFTVTNQGDVALTNIVIQDPLFQAPNPVVAITFDGVDNGNNELDITETWTYSATYTLTATDIINEQVDNQAIVSGESGAITVSDFSGSTISNDNITSTVITGIPNPGMNGSIDICSDDDLSELELFAALGGTPQSGGDWTNAGGMPVTFPLSIAGAYTYTVFNGASCSASATITVTVTTVPEAGVSSGDIEFCSTDTISITETTIFGNLIGADVGGTWTDAGGSLVSFPITTAGTYTYTVAAPPCTVDDTATVNITVTTAPEAGVSSGDIEFCSTETISVTEATIFTNLTGADTGGAWTDSGGALVSFPITAAGTYTYTVAAIFPCTADDISTVNITVTTAPEAGVSNGDFEFCSTDTISITEAIIFANLTGADAGGTWTDAGGSLVSFPITTSGIYTYTLTATAPCTVDDTVSVTVSEQAQPVAGTTTDFNICTGDTVTLSQLNASLSGADTGGTWSPALVGGGTYTYTVTATAPCTVDATVSVTVSEQTAPEAGTSTDFSICAGDTVSLAQLNASLSGADTGGTWSPALAGAGTYTYTVSLCSINDSVSVTVNEVAAPVAGTATDFSICAGDTVTLAQLNASLSGADTGGTWSPALAGGGVYTYTVAAMPPCTVDATVSVTVSEQAQPVAGTTTDFTICVGDTVTLVQLNASLSGADGGGTWTPALAGIGTYTYTVPATAPCTVDASVTVNVTNLSGLDSDADGLPDVCDLDDDNDGILDENEVSLTSYGGDIFGINQSGMSNSENALGNTPSTSAIFNTNANDPRIGINFGGVLLPAGTQIRITLSPSRWGFQAINGVGNPTGGITNVDSFSGTGPRVIFYTLPVAACGVLIYRFLNFSEERIYMIEYNLPPAVSDADGDGLPNSLDLDSDGDGCPDAIEATENVTDMQLLPSGAIDIVNHGGVDSDGVPNAVASGGQGQANDLESLINTQVTISSVPQDQVVIEGDAASFNFSASATSTTGAYTLCTQPGRIVYEWYLGNPSSGGTLLTNSGVYSGTNGNTLNISNTTGLIGNEYCVRITHTGLECYEEIRCATLLDLCANPADPDTDNDGLNDICDLDDDNDGILDTDENAPSPSSIYANVVDGSSNFNSANNALGSNPANFAESRTIFANKNLVLGMPQVIPAGTQVRVLVSMASGSGTLNIGRSYLTGFNGPNFVSNLPVTTTPTEHTFTVTANIDLSRGFYFFTRSNRLRIHFINVVNNETDSDQDGIINSLDLDSDNDGCVDAIEGAENITASQLLPNGAINIAAQGGIDSQGVPNAVSAGGQGQARTSQVLIPNQVVVTTPLANASVAVEGDPTSFTIGARGDQTSSYSGSAPNTVPNYSNPGNANAGINYQWYLGDPTTTGVALSDMGVYSGTSTGTLNISNTTGLIGNDYCVVITHDDNECIDILDCGLLILNSCTTPPNAGSNGAETICSNDNFTEAELFAALGGSPDLGGSWTDAASSPVTFPVTSSGSYTYTVVGTGTCTGINDTAVVTATVDPMPNAGSNASIDICSNDSISEAELFALLGGTPDLNGAWTDASLNSVVFPVSLAGDYTYTVNGVATCTGNTTTATVTVTNTSGLDSDSDGLPDICDLDDDNDGILDTDEIQLINTGFSYEFPAGGVLNINNILGDTPTTFATFPFVGRTRVRLENDAQLGETVSFLLSNTSGNSGDFFIRVLNDAGATISTEYIDVASTTPQEYTIVMPATTDHFYISWLGSSAGEGRFYRIKTSANPDFDMDGIVNELDLDSDNDGCSDAIEGAENITADQLLPSGAIDITNQGGIDADGVPQAVSAGGQGQSSTDALTSSDVISNVVITPDPAEVCENENITLTATPTGIRVTDFGATGAAGDDTTIAIPTADYTYTWYLGSSTTPLTDVAPYSGTSTAALTITNTPAVFDANSYRVEVTTVNNSCPEEDSISLTVSPAPVAGTATDFSICEGDTLTLAQLNASLSGADTGGTWSPAIAGAGTYTYTVAATAPCSVDASVSVTVSEQAQPVAGTATDFLICTGDTVTLAQLNASLSGADAGGTWSPALAGGGVYTYTVAAIAPCTVDATVDVTVTEQAVPEAGTTTNFSICAGDTVTLAQLDASLSGADAGGTWTPALAGAGDYTYEVSLCSTNDSVTVTVSEQAQPEAGTTTDFSICAGSTVTLAQLNASLSGADMGGTWSPALAGGGTYTYTVAATAPCTVDDSVSVIVSEQVAPVAGTTTDFSICAGSTVTLAQLNASLSGADAGGTWTPALAGAGDYTYTVTATAPCTVDAMVSVTVTNITGLDTDLDGLPDVCDLDDDNDGILDTDEIFQPSDTNIALSGVATSSSFRTDPICPGGTCSPDLAIDGSTNGFFPSGLTYHTAGSVPTHYWDLDLVTESVINQIQVFNRTDCCDNRLRNAYVLIADTPFPTDVNDVSGSVANADFQFQFSSTDTGNETITVPSTVGRYVRIQLSGTNPGGNVMNFAEVQVFGYATSLEIIDTDKDGINNDLDFDSDNDGCPDAIEAAENLAIDQLLPSGAIDITNQGGIDADGVPQAVSAGGQGQATTTALTSSDVISNVTIAPDPAGVCENENITLTATPTGIRVTDFGATGGTGDDTTIAIPTADYTYAWYLGASTTPLTDVAPYSGTSTAALTITNTPSGFDANSYRVEVTTVNNSCPEEDTISLTVATVPEAGVSSGDIEFCSTDTISVTEATIFGNLTGADAGGTWTDAGGTALSFPITTSGTYTYTVATPPCTVDDTAVVNVTVTPAPEAGVSSGDIEFCSTDTISITEATIFGNLTGADAGGTWTDAGGTALSFPITTSGSYTYTVSATLPCTVDDTAVVNVTVTPAPEAGVSSGDIEFCSTDTISVTEATIFGNLTGADAGGTWTDAGGTALSFPITTSGTYTYTVATPPCTVDDTAVVNVTVTPAPEAGVSSGDIEFCSTDTISITEATIFGNLTGADAGGTWTDAGGTALSFPITTSGSYTYTVSATLPCTVDDTAVVNVTVTPAPEAGVSSGDIEFCSTDTLSITEATIFGNLTGADAGGTWTDAGGTALSFPITTSGSYTYTVSATLPCTVDDTAVVNVTVTPAPEAGVSSGDIEFCSTDTISITEATIFGNLTGADAGGTWTDAGGTALSFPITTSGSYTYTVSATLPCTVDDTAVVNVTVTPAPEAGVSSGDIEFCSTDTISITEATIFGNLTGADAGGTWTDAGGTALSFPITTSGSYTYTVSATLPCTVDDTAVVNVTVTPAPEAGVSSGDIEFCSTDTISITEATIFGNLTGADAGGTWTDAGGTALSFPITTSGSYTYTVSATLPCTVDDTAVVNVTVTPAPEAGVSSGDIEFCSTDTISVTEATIFGNLTGADAGGTWTDASGTALSFPITTSGSYTYTVSATLPCTVDDTAVVNVTVTPAPEAGVSSGDIEFCSTDTLSVTEATIFGNLTGADAGGTWTDATANLVTFPINTTGVYTYTVNGLGSCASESDAVSVAVTIIPCIPPSISLENESVINDENGDGIIQVGETIAYNFTVTNGGDVTISNIEIDSPFLGGVICNISALAPGSINTSCNVSYSITQMDIDNGIIVNIATAIGQDPNGIDVIDTSDDPNDTTNFDINGDGDPDDPTENILIDNPLLSLEVDAVFNDENGDGFAKVDETIIYGYTVTNTGNVTLTDIEVNDLLFGEMICTTLSLAPNESYSTCDASHIITRQDIQNGAVESTATVSGKTPNGGIITAIPDDVDGATLITFPEIPFKIHNAISANDGDGLNDFFILSGIENFPNNNVKIFNRWGVLVFETDGYGGSSGKENVFEGRSNGRANIASDRLLPAGTYYYIIIREDPSTGESLSNNGFLYINN